MSSSPVIRVAVSGLGGRMGRAALAEAAGFDDIRIVGGFGRAAGVGPDDVPVLPPARAPELIADVDVVLDVSSPSALAALLDSGERALEGRALIVGTTGLDAETEARLHALSDRAAILLASNFSLGISLLEALVARAADILPAESFDIEIVETHHGGKADAPSGTALTLGRAAAAARGKDLDEVRTDGRSGAIGPRPAGQIGFHALRGGAVPGEHRIHFLGRRERIELAHQALDRAVFAEGAIRAVRWIAARPPGHYTMHDVLGL